MQSYEAFKVGSREPLMFRVDSCTKTTAPPRKRGCVLRLETWILPLWECRCDATIARALNVHLSVSPSLTLFLFAQFRPHFNLLCTFT